MYEYGGAYIDCRCGRSFPASAPDTQKPKKPTDTLDSVCYYYEFDWYYTSVPVPGITPVPRISSFSPLTSPTFSFLFFRFEGTSISSLFFHFSFFFPSFFFFFFCFSLCVPCCLLFAIFVFSFPRVHTPAPSPPVPRRKLDPVIILFDRSAVGPEMGREG